MEGETVVVGGYQSHTGTGAQIAYSEAKWFLLTLDRKNAPWAYERGEPFRSIASLELLGTLLGVMLLLDDDHEGGATHTARISVGGLTDNIGNRFAVARLLTTKWPLAAFVSELATQLEDKNL